MGSSTCFGLHHSPVLGPKAKCPERKSRAEVITFVAKQPGRLGCHTGRSPPVEAGLCLAQFQGEGTKPEGAGRAGGIRNTAVAIVGRISYSCIRKGQAG